MALIRVWTRITDAGDGSQYIELYPSKAAAREGLDDDDFPEGEDMPVQIEYNDIETDDYASPVGQEDTTWA